MHVFQYRVHGLTVSSEFECPELLPAGGPPDVVVRQGAVPDRLDAPARAGVLFQAGPDQYLLRVDGTAAYWARTGRDVVVQVEPGASDVRVRAFFYDAVIPAVLLQRGAFVMHAAALVGSTGAVLIAGHSASGKSTLLAALAGRGVRVLADDIAAIVTDPSGRLVVHPGVPRVGLWKDAAKRPVALAGAFDESSHPLSSIVVLGLANAPSVDMAPVDQHERFALLSAHTRSLRLVDGFKMHGAHLRLGAAVASRVPMWRMRRPPDQDSVTELLTRVQPLLQ